MVFLTTRLHLPYFRRWLDETCVGLGPVAVVVAPPLKNPPKRWARVYGTDAWRVL